MKDPPKHVATDVGHWVHFPGSVILVSEKYVPLAHKSQLPLSENFSPILHSLNWMSKWNSGYERFIYYK